MKAEKKCQFCGVDFTASRHDYKFCSRACGHKYWATHRVTRTQSPSYMRRAHVSVQRAIWSGRLVKKPCEVCGNEKSQAHHEDYSNRLDVRWLCQRHHSAVHHAN